MSPVPNGQHNPSSYPKDYHAAPHDLGYGPDSITAWNLEDGPTASMTGWPDQSGPPYYADWTMYNGEFMWWGFQEIRHRFAWPSTWYDNNWPNQAHPSNIGLISPMPTKLQESGYWGCATYTWMRPFSFSAPPHYSYALFLILMRCFCTAPYSGRRYDSEAEKYVPDHTFMWPWTAAVYKSAMGDGPPKILVAGVPGNSVFESGDYDDDGCGVCFGVPIWPSPLIPEVDDFAPFGQGLSVTEQDDGQTPMININLVANVDEPSARGIGAYSVAALKGEFKLRSLLITEPSVYIWVNASIGDNLEYDTQWTMPRDDE